MCQYYQRPLIHLVSNLKYICIRYGKTFICFVINLILANLTQTKKGKQLLDKYYPALIKETFEAMSSYLRNLSTDLKNRAFNTLEMVFSTESSNQTDIE